MCYRPGVATGMRPVAVEAGCGVAHGLGPDHRDQGKHLVDLILGNAENLDRHPMLVDVIRTADRQLLPQSLRQAESAGCGFVESMRCRTSDGGYGFQAKPAYRLCVGVNSLSLDMSRISMLLVCCAVIRRGAALSLKRSSGWHQPVKVGTWASRRHGKQTSHSVR